ncbi:transmembrane protein 225B isoform X1 [Mustela erminea]|uniref:transmembrane protein 225B isoform X1 n=1 Tax=Mustela erminea TaxID=36723 RepID=UPI0013866E93|nr:transmembrane protein 225B isoform X1 [Mustela erminea]
MEKLPEQITPESLYPSSQQEPRKSKDAVTFAWNILHLVDPDHSSRSSSTSFFEAAISSSPRNKKTDTQEGEITYPRSPSWEWQSWNSNSDLPGSGSLPPPSAHPPRTAAEARDCRAESQLPRACKFLFSSLNRCLWPKLGMGRPVMMTLENKDMKGFTWAIAPALTSLGYLLILLVSIFPFWVRLVNEESHEVFFSGLFENCFHIKCWKPRPLSVYIILGRVFLLSAVVLSFLTTFVLVSFASQLFPRTWKHNLVSAFISFLTGVEEAGRPCPQARLGLGKGSGWGDPKAGRWLVSVMSGEREFLGPLLPAAFSEAACSPGGQSLSLGAAWAPALQLVQPLLGWLGVISLGFFFGHHLYPGHCHRIWCRMTMWK